MNMGEEFSQQINQGILNLKLFSEFNIQNPRELPQQEMKKQEFEEDEHK